MLCYISNIRASELSSILVCCQSVNYVSSFDHFYKYLNVFMILHSHFKWWWSDERLYGPGLAFKCLVNGCFIKIEGKILTFYEVKPREKAIFLCNNQNEPIIHELMKCLCLWHGCLGCSSFPLHVATNWIGLMALAWQYNVVGWLARWLLLTIFHTTSCITLCP